MYIGKNHITIERHYNILLHTFSTSSTSCSVCRWIAFTVCDNTNSHGWAIQERKLIATAHDILVVDGTIPLTKLWSIEYRSILWEREKGCRNTYVKSGSCTSDSIFLYRSTEVNIPYCCRLQQHPVHPIHPHKSHRRFHWCTLPLFLQWKSLHSHHFHYSVVQIVLGHHSTEEVLDTYKGILVIVY